VRLFEMPLLNHTGLRGVYEPAVGSGTAMIAAEKHGRACYEMDLNPRYVQAAVTRWDAFTGQNVAPIPPIRAERYNGKRSGWPRWSTAMTLGLTPRAAEGSGLHGLRGFGQELALHEGQSGAILRAPGSREFWPVFRRGGMAEWSMAVVLKT
jgi:hypothetical protein